MVLNQNTQIISSPALLASAGMFRDVTWRGDLFAMFRNPVDRAVTFFYTSQNPGDRHYDPVLVGMSLEDYANWPEDRPEFNWMVKSLVSSGHDLVESTELTEEDLELAKLILERKCLVLLQSERRESWERLVEYMGWAKSIENPTQQDCIGTILDEPWPLLDVKNSLDASDPIYAKFSERNSFDMQLYEFAVILWEIQGKRFGN